MNENSFAGSLSRKYPSNLQQALDTIINEYTRYREERTDWEYERVQLQNQLTNMKKETMGATSSVEVLARRISMLESALVDSHTLVASIETVATEASYEEVLSLIRRNREAAPKIKVEKKAEPSSPRSLGKYKTMPVTLRAKFAVKPKKQGRENLKTMLGEMGYSYPSKDVTAYSSVSEEVVDGPETKHVGLEKVAKKKLSKSDKAALFSGTKSSALKVKKKKKKSPGMESLLGSVSRKEKPVGNGGSTLDLDEPVPTKSEPSVSFMDDLNDMDEDQLAAILPKGSKVNIKGKRRSKLKTTKKSTLSNWTPLESPMSGTAEVWTSTAILTDHMDTVRDIDQLSNAILSASDDGTVKLWNLKSQTAVNTFFGHVGIVSSVYAVESRGVFFSGGEDGKIIASRIPEFGEAEYGEVGNVLKYKEASYAFHKDIVWDIKAQIVDDATERQLIFSASGNSVAIWRHGTNSPFISSLEHTAQGCRHHPTGLAPLPTDSNKLAVSYRNGDVVVFDVTTGTEITCFKNKNLSWVTSLCAHPNNTLLFSGSVDNSIHFLDMNSGESVYEMLAHTSIVSTVSVDPSGNTLVSGDHDSSLRFWNISDHKCIQDLASHQTHRKKQNEGIQKAMFHVTSGSLVSAGTDGAIRMYSRKNHG